MLNEIKINPAYTSVQNKMEEKGLSKTGYQR